ncbi:MAG: hypothetical protein KA444_08170, partial [Bacteroidia bacterium]|nr:hypothetical protein [Bacteroidia bacterium]
DLDRFGNCYMVGITWVADSTKDIVIMKFTPDGQELWRRFYDGPAHRDDIPVAMSLDHYGDVIVAGTSKNKMDNTDICLVKFSNEGVPVFAKNLEGGSDLFDAPSSVVCDPIANIYMGGYVTTQDSGLNMAVYRFLPDGTFSWLRTSGSINMDVANVLVTDDSCNVYVGGNYNVAMRTSDMIIQKYDSSGLKKWDYVYDGTLSMGDAVLHLAPDDSSNLYFSGFLNHGSDRSDIPVFKMSRNGEMLQENLFFGGMTDCSSKQIYVDKSGVYLTALQTDYMRGTGTTIAIHYDKAGNQRMLSKNEKGIRFGKIVSHRGDMLILGTGLIRPENTLIPFVAEPDSNGILVWEYADSTIAGLTHMLDYRVRGDKLYFLADDTGEATGTITLLCYQLKKDSATKPKGSSYKPTKGAIRKN